jgi:competence protein ComGC
MMEMTSLIIYSLGEDPMLKSGFDSGEVLIVLAVVSVCLLILTGVLAGLFIQRQMMKSRKSCERKGNHQQWEKMTTYKSTGDSVQMLP